MGGIIAIHGSRGDRDNPTATISRLYNSGSAWGDAANIAFSVAFLFYVPLRFLLFWRIVVALPSITDQPGGILLPLASDAANCQDGSLATSQFDRALLEEILSLADIPAFPSKELCTPGSLNDRWWLFEF